MRFPLKSILIGILIGSALFFAPFGFPFFFFFFFIFVFGRFWGRWGYWSRWDYPRNYYTDDVTPIDGQTSYQKWSRTEAEKKININ